MANNWKCHENHNDRKGGTCNLYSNIIDKYFYNATSYILQISKTVLTSVRDNLISLNVTEN